MKNLLQKIDYMMERRGIKSKRQLAEMAGIPGSTLTSFYNKGYDKMKLSTLKMLAKSLGVSIDYLARDEITDPDYGISEHKNEKMDLTFDEQQLVTDYREFNAEGKEKVRDYVADLKHNPKYKKRDEPALGRQA